VFELEAGQRPALGAVLEREHRVGHAEVAQDLRAHDAAGAARAMHHDRRALVAHLGAPAQRQFAVGHGNGAGQRHLAMLLERAAIEQHERLGLALPARQRGRVDVRHLEGMLGDLAEGLRRQVHALEQRAARAFPGRRAAGQHRDAGPAERGQPHGRAPGQRIAVDTVVEQHGAGRAARHQPRHLGLEPAVGRMHREEGMALAVLAVLADVEQREFVAVLQPALQGGGIDGGHAFGGGGGRGRGRGGRRAGGGRREIGE
jgi:hypothetical protein